MRNSKPRNVVDIGSGAQGQARKNNWGVQPEIENVKQYFLPKRSNLDKYGPFRTRTYLIAQWETPIYCSMACFLGHKFLVCPMAVFSSIVLLHKFQEQSQWMWTLPFMLTKLLCHATGKRLLFQYSHVFWIQYNHCNRACFPLDDRD